MKIVVLDGYTENPGDLSWDEMKKYGELTVYDRTPAEEVVNRIGNAEVVFTNKTPITKDTMGYNVAIDGPAGAGKSTIAKLVAKEKGYIYVDTGAMYRGLAIHFLDKGIQPQETEKVIEACKDAEVTIAYEDAVQHVYLNGKDISSRLRNEEVGNMASVTSAIPEVRKKLLELQQNLAKTQNVIMDGRDIGTCVLPHADVKVYLTASVETRAKRRYQELQEKGEDCNLEEIAHDIEERDRRDMTREIAPLKQAEDAVLVDSSDMTIAEVVKTIVDLCR